MAPVYVYKVRDGLGKTHAGEIEAESKELVVDRLRQTGYFITKVEPKLESPSIGEVFAKWSAVTPKDLAVFFRQFATMINSGLPLLKCLNILVEQTEKKKLQESLEDIRRDVESGTSLSQAMGKHRDVFPTFVTAMARAGEAGGFLDNVMDRLTATFENEHEVREKVKGALRYPLIVLTFAFLVVILMLTFIIPNFMSLFDTMKIQLPLPTRIILGVSGFLRSHFILLAVVTILIVIAGLRYYRTPEGKAMFDKFVLKVPVFGELMLKNSLAKSSRSLGTLLASGVPIIQALEITQGIAGNAIVAGELGEVCNGVRDGDAMAKHLERSKVFTPMMVNMIAVGEETGTLEDMLLKIADFYDKEVKYMTENMTSLIEPFLILILGVVIGGIMLSIMLPIFEVYSHIGG
ncbi:type II secretion system F family protein [Phosphitispora sp. TUW77]|uniref:type II secretion system F family protein n=1 Tax=Phosphitispora sp. TUW77 TaxID=3152361 RepID=UPI003AB814D2